MSSRLEINQTEMQFSQSTCTVPWTLHIWARPGAYNRKVGEFKQMSPPTDLTEVRKFLGFVGYYTKFILKYSDIA